MDFVKVQMSTSVLLLLTGMVLGGFLDLYRVFRATVKVNKLIDFFGDLIFWILAVILLTPLIFWSTWLELRLYVWLFLLIGLLMYYFLFSQILIPFFLKFWHAVTWVPRQLYHGTQWLKLTIKKNFWWLKLNRNKKRKSDQS